MKKLILALAATCALAVTNASALPTVIFTDGPGGPGGEFNAYSTEHGDFITFCVEFHEEHQLNTQYYYTISQSNSSGQALTLAQAWLYLQFGNGTLSDFGAQYAYDHSESKAYDLQWAFWYLGNPDWGTNYYAQLALQQAGAGNNNGFYDVAIMNLWDNPDATGPHQDQLVKVPDSTSTLVLTGLGLAALSLVRRRRTVLN